MESTKIVKHIDRLGRFKLPSQWLKQNGINPNSYVKLTRGKARIVIEPGIRKCIFCHSTENIHVFKDEFFCDNCMQAISKRYQSK